MSFENQLIEMPLEETATPTEGAAVSFFERAMGAAITGNAIEERKRLAKEARFILKDIAMEGQVTILYASSGTGKTLLVFHMLAQADKTGRDIIYLNADDTFVGATEKAELMASKGIHMIVPGQKSKADQEPFETRDLDPLIRELVKTGKAQTTTIVLDTLKKFASLMDKQEASKFGTLARHFVEGGGTMVTLAHTNKHKGADDKAVYEGVGDFISDFDAGYIIDLDTPIEQADRQVTFRNVKNRGPNKLKVSFRYDAGEGVKWIDRYNSVQLVDDGHARALIEEQAAQQQYAADHLCIEYLNGRLRNGPLTYKELTQDDLNNAFSRGWREKVLEKYTEENRLEAHRIFRRTQIKPRGFRYELLR